MPRTTRLIIPDVAIHVIQRGNNRADCFRQDADRLVYMLHLRELSRKHGCLVHAYCLMTNHIHLLVTPTSHSACTSLMRDLGQRYVQYFNRRYGRTGTLWEGRYRSCLAESARYVLACYRYIELNPVRADMVSCPGEYAWSSYRSNVGDRTDPFVTPHAEFESLGATLAARQSTYRAVVADGLDPALVGAIREATNSGYPLCGEGLRQTLSAAGHKLERGRPGPRPKECAELNSGSDPELFSGGAAS
jgi:putative transposase